jgi:hypothetical protein
MTLDFGFCILAVALKSQQNKVWASNTTVVASVEVTGDKLSSTQKNRDTVPAEAQYTVISNAV